VIDLIGVRFGAIVGSDKHPILVPLCAGEPGPDAGLSFQCRFAVESWAGSEAIPPTLGEGVLPSGKAVLGLRVFGRALHGVE
jgi:hypothetical protein